MSHPPSFPISRTLVIGPLLIAAALLIAGCSSADQTDRSSDANAHTIDVQGHRGARGLRPENTLPSFEVALDAEVTTLELDLHLSQDGRLVIWHDPVVTSDKCRAGNKTLPNPGTFPLVRKLTAAQLGQYVCDGNPDPVRYSDQQADTGGIADGRYSIITLPDLFEFVDRYAGDDTKTDSQRANAAAVQFNVETKRRADMPETIGDDFDGTTPGTFERTLAAVITEWGYEDRVIVQSFDHRSLWALHTIAATVRLAALTVDERPDFAMLVDSGATIWSPRFSTLSIEIVTAAHSAGLDVIPWTVNSAADVCTLLDMGVAGLITDRPDLMLSEWLSDCRGAG